MRSTTALLHQPQIRVPHLRGGLIAAKAGLREANRSCPRQTCRRSYDGYGSNGDSMTQLTLTGMLRRSLLHRRARSISALIAMTVSAGVATALLTLYADLDTKLHKEFRSFGANIVLTAPANTPLPSDALDRVHQIAGPDALAAEFAYAVATTDTGTPVVVAGTDFAAVRNLNSWWQVDQWPAEQTDQRSSGTPFMQSYRMPGSPASVCRSLGWMSGPSHASAIPSPHPTTNPGAPFMRLYRMSGSSRASAIRSPQTATGSSPTQALFGRPGAPFMRLYRMSGSSRASAIRSPQTATGSSPTQALFGRPGAPFMRLYRMPGSPTSVCCSLGWISGPSRAGAIPSPIPPPLQPPTQALFGNRAANAAGNKPAITLTYANKPITVEKTGRLTTGGDEDSRIYMPLAAFTTWTGVNPSVIELQVPGGAKRIEATLTQLQSALPGLQVQPVRQLVEGESRIVDRTHALMFGAVLLIALTVAVSVLATLSASVLERRRDFALMKALGGSQGTLMGMFLLEALVLALSGVAAGFIAGSAAAWAISEGNFHTATLPHLSVLPMVLLLNLAIASLAALLPARVLRGLQPAALLKGE